MSSYALYLITSLIFYAAGILMIVSSNRPAGAAFIAIGCTFFAIALSRRKKRGTSSAAGQPIPEPPFNSDVSYENLATQLFKENDDALCSHIRRTQPSIEKLDEACLARDSATALLLSISFKKWNTAQCLHQMGARLSPHEKRAGNEFVYVAPYLYDEAALAFGDYLLAASVSLSEKSRKSGATALHDICHMVLTDQTWSPASRDFLIRCFESADREAVFSQDKYENSAWSFIHQYYPQDVIDIVESLHPTAEKETSKD